MNIFTKNVKSLVAVLLFLQLGCSTDDQEVESLSLKRIEKVMDIAPGFVCERGGVKIVRGIDLNSNTILEANEIVTSTFSCY